MRSKLILILSLFALPLWAGGPAETMQQAYDLYRQGERERALALWEDLRGAGYVSPALFYNLGNGYFESGQLGKAILNYERALLLQPAHPKVRRNLELARRQVEGEPLSWPGFSLLERWRALRGLLPSDIWALLGLAACWGALAAAWLGRRQTRYWPWLAGMIAGIGLAMLAWMLAWSSTRALSSDFSVAMTGPLPVQVGPDRQSGVVDTLYEGWKVLRLDQIGNWIKVELPDGQEGWVTPEGLEPL
jgi:hypothetical protein